MKALFITSDDCTPCADMKKKLASAIAKGEVTEVNFEKDPDKVTDLINKYEANIPGILVLTDDDQLIIKS